MGFAVVLFDMTNLKAANEELGHFGADAVLARVGGLVRDGFDHAFRHGGDEFAVVLPCANLGGGMLVRDRIEKRVGVSYLDCGAVVCLVGAVGTWVPGTDLGMMLNKTDKALEQRKVRVKDGTGRVR